MARPFRQEFGNLSGCTQLPEFSSKNRVSHTVCFPRFKEKRCKSLLWLNKSNTESDVAEAGAGKA